MSGRSRAISMGGGKGTDAEVSWRVGDRWPTASVVPEGTVASEGKTFRKMGLCHISVFKGDRNGEEGAYSRATCLLQKERTLGKVQLGEGRDKGGFPWPQAAAPGIQKRG